MSKREAQDDKKLSRRQRREKIAEKASTKGLTREDVYKKPPLAVLYDKMNPGDYTIRQDFYHSLFIFAFIFIIFACIITMSITNIVRDSSLHESKLTIPASSFVSGQEGTVFALLDGYGFIDISYDEDGDIVAWGTSDMVQEYKDSFYEKNVKAITDKIEGDFTESGIESIQISDDYKTLTINTYRDMTYTSSAFSKMVESKDVSNIIDKLYEWCGMRNDGEAMTTRFVNVMDMTDGSTGTQYWQSNAHNASQMVAELEKEEKASLDAETEDGKAADETTNEARR